MLSLIPTLGDDDASLDAFGAMIENANRANLEAPNRETSQQLYGQAAAMPRDSTHLLSLIPTLGDDHASLEAFGAMIERVDLTRLDRRLAEQYTPRTVAATPDPDRARLLQRIHDVDPEAGARVAEFVQHVEELTKLKERERGRRLGN
ncbi:hypothetical protein XbrCFBP1976_08265 [Xanthomonas bromi]|uniref:Uncharacterized protein n=1 Tax=Xanthomonas bromi TaxID=56449 RepID=A0ABX5BRT1_9XANT|nr:hypothetical protein XbrCFBP1976_08265 [Xanthomonas bromi]